MSLLARQSAGSLLARGAAPLALPKPRLLAWQCVRVDAAKVASAPRYFGVLYAMAMSSSVQVHFRSLQGQKSAMIQKVFQLQVLAIMCFVARGPGVIAMNPRRSSELMSNVFSGVEASSCELLAWAKRFTRRTCMMMQHRMPSLTFFIQCQASLAVQDTQRGSSTGSPMTSGPDGNALQHDWVHQLELDSALELSRRLGGPPLRVLVLYGSLRERSYSKLLALEFSRSVFAAGAVLF